MNVCVLYTHVSDTCEIGPSCNSITTRSDFEVSPDIGLVIIRIQWNLSITDALGPEKQFVVQRFPLFRGYLI